MYQHAHRRLQVVYSVVFAFEEGAEVPQARPHRFDGFVDPVLGRLVGVLRLGVIQSGPVERGEVLVVGARPIAQRLPLGVGGVHGLERVDDPLGGGALLDLLPQRLELLLLLVVVGLEVIVGQHLVHVFIEAVGFHELVIEIERHRVPHRHSPLRQPELAEFRHVGRLDTEDIPVVEGDVSERCDRLDRQISNGSLRRRWPRRRMMVVHLLLGGRSEGVALVRRGEIHMLADQSFEVVVFEEVANEGVGHAILDGAQIDVRQRRLRDCADRPGHARQIIRQRLVDGDVGGPGLVTVRHEPQPAVAFRLVEGDIVHIGHQVLEEQDVDPGSVILGFLRLVLSNSSRDVQDLVVGQTIVFSDHRHRCSQNGVDSLGPLKRFVAPRPEVVTVDTESSVGSDNVGLPSYCAVVPVVVRNIHFGNESIVPRMASSVN